MMTTNESGPDEGNTLKKRILNVLIYHKDISIFVFTVILLAIFASVNRNFISGQNVGTILKNIPELGIVALGMTMLIIAGEFDLSVGSTFALAPFIMAFIATNVEGIPLFIAMLAAIVAGCIIGMINGLITTKIGVPSFITTLGMMMVVRGLMLLFSKGFPQSFHSDKPLADIFTASPGGFPVQFLWFIFIAFILWMVLENTRFGNWTYVTGGNKSAAIEMGIPVDRIKILNFMLVGGLSAIAGSIQVFRMHSAYPIQGTGMELNAIAAVVVGGTLLTGGVGTIVGTVMGVLILFSVENILILSQAPTFWFRLFVGLVILVSVSLRITSTRRKK